MSRAPGPLLLTRPTRFAGLPRPAARAILGIAALLVLLSLLALATPVSSGPAQAAGAARQTDLLLYRTIVERMRHGDTYYAAAADALRGGGYPLRPFVAFRLPTLARIQAALPEPAIVAILWALVATVLAAWWRRLAPAFARPTGRVAAFLLLLGGTVAFWQAALAPFHELWAGLLIALSLALHDRRRWVEPVAFGLAACLIRETAALYLLVMGALAIIRGGRREAAGWAAALGLFGLALAAHAHGVAQVVRTLDPASPGWSGMLGPGFFVRALTTGTALSLFPVWIAGPLVALALVGWAAWRDRLGSAILATLAAYALLLALFARPDNFYWALLIAPASLAGLAFAPDALRDLFAAALDSRRIIVRRVVR